MIDISFDGRILSEAGSPINGAYVQPYFERVNSGSSASTWGSAQQVGSQGYFSFNLGDGDFLTQDGTAGNGDRVLIAVWSGGTDATRLGTNKTNFAFRVVTVAGDTMSQQDVHALADRVPTTAFSVPVSATRLTTLALANTSTDNVTVSPDVQAHSYAGVTVFDAVGVDHTHVDWGDGTSENLSGSSYGSHSYSVPPDTVVTVTGRAYDVKGQAGNVVTHDILITDSLFVPFSLDALVQRTGVTAATGLDARVQALLASTLGIDALLLAVRSGTLSLNALVQILGRSRVTSMDVIVEDTGVPTEWLMLDALVGSRSSLSSVLDALVGGARSGALSLDALLLGTQTRRTSLSAVVMGVGTEGSVLLEGIVVTVGTPVALVDALVLGPQAYRTRFDAIIRPPQIYPREVIDVLRYSPSGR